MHTVDLQRFHDDGFVVLRGAIDPAHLAAARAAIADALRADTSIGMMPKYLADTFCPSIVDHPAILGLLDPLRPAIATLFATSTPPTPDTAQIALRFPQYARTDPRHGYHLDGFPSALNGVPAGTIYRHTLLAGVYLTPLRGPDRGNLVVWPGSHRALARFLRDLDAPAFLAAHGADSLLQRIRAHDIAPITEHQIEVEPGDAVLAHHLLAHGASDNLSMQLRETIYFRLLHPDDHAQDPAPLTDAARFFAPAPAPR